MAHGNEYGHGVEWYRDRMLGKGYFGRAFLATPKNPGSKHSSFPPRMAVKSTKVPDIIQKEREVLRNIQGCPDIVRCFGEETTIGEDGDKVYNLLLEYCSGGTLEHKIKESCYIYSHGLSDLEGRFYTRCILRGLNHIHGLGYVHCDLKTDNILLVPYNKGGVIEFRTKICDFGGSRGTSEFVGCWRGTPKFLSPEAVIHGVQDPPADIWALGCLVIEMLTGTRAWDRNEWFEDDEIIRKVGSGGECPEIPNEISKEARDFVRCCFERDPACRPTAQMLLQHPFVGGFDDDDYRDDDENYAVGEREVEHLKADDCKLWIPERAFVRVYHYVRILVCSIYYMARLSCGFRGEG